MSDLTVDKILSSKPESQHVHCFEIRSLMEPIAWGATCTRCDKSYGGLGLLWGAVLYTDQAVRADCTPSDRFRYAQALDAVAEFDCSFDWSGDCLTISPTDPEEWCPSCIAVAALAAR